MLRSKTVSNLREPKKKVDKKKDNTNMSKTLKTNKSMGHFLIKDYKKLHSIMQLFSFSRYR